MPLFDYCCSQMKTVFLLAALAEVGAASKPPSFVPLLHWSDCENFKVFDNSESMQRFVTDSIEAARLPYLIAMLELAKGCGLEFEILETFPEQARAYLITKLKSNPERKSLTDRYILLLNELASNTEFKKNPTLDLAPVKQVLDAGEVNTSIGFKVYAEATRLAMLDLTGLLLNSYYVIDSIPWKTCDYFDRMKRQPSKYQFEQLYYKQALLLGLPSALSFLKAAAKCFFESLRVKLLLKKLPEQVGDLISNFWNTNEEMDIDDRALGSILGLGFTEDELSSIIDQLEAFPTASDVALVAVNAATKFADDQIRGAAPPAHVLAEDVRGHLGSQAAATSAVTNAPEFPHPSRPL